MPNPAKTPYDVHLTALQSALAASQRVTAGCLNLLVKQQQMLTENGNRRRAGDGRATAGACPDGADLMHNYGRRCHDVDIERL